MKGPPLCKRKKGRYYIDEKALKEHYYPDDDAAQEANNGQEESEITHHFIDHLRVENFLKTTGQAKERLNAPYQMPD